jgi:hypothetical protein
LFSFLYSSVIYSSETLSVSTCPKNESGPWILPSYSIFFLLSWTLLHVFLYVAEFYTSFINSDSWKRKLWIIHVGYWFLHILFFCYIYIHPVVSKRCGNSFYSLFSLLNMLETETVSTGLSYELLSTH